LSFVAECLEPERLAPDLEPERFAPEGLDPLWERERREPERLEPERAPERLLGLLPLLDGLAEAPPVAGGTAGLAAAVTTVTWAAALGAATGADLLDLLLWERECLEPELLLPLLWECLDPELLLPLLWECLDPELLLLWERECLEPELFDPELE